MKKSHERVQFFSKSDGSCWYYLEKIETVLNDWYDPVNIMDIIELYHVKKFVDCDIFKGSWQQNNNDYYKDVIIKIPQFIRQFYSKSKFSLVELYKQIELYEYEKSFWEIAVEYRIIEDWDEEYFKLIASGSDIHTLLLNKRIVKQFGSYIRDRLLEEEDAPELIIREYAFNEIISSPIYLPEELSESDIFSILLKYINSQSPNLNYLRGVTTLSKGSLKIPDKIKYQAKKKSDELEKRFFSEGHNYYTYGIGVKYEENQNPYIVVSKEDDVNVFSYDLSWILENQDYQTLLNNFIYLYEFVDTVQFRATFINNREHLGVFERFMGPYYKHAYNPGSFFNIKLQLGLLQIGSYYSLLKDRNGIRLEDVITKFFSEYLPIEFNIKDYRILMPSEKSTFLEKCRTIAPEIDKVLKELYILKTEGYVDHGILQISSNSLPLDSIPSLIKRKYFIGYGEDFQKASYYLCSDQCMLHYVERLKKSYKSFFKLVSDEIVYLKDYEDGQVSEIEWLQNQKFIDVKEDGKIYLTKSAVIVKDLYDNHSINYWHYPKVFRKNFQELQEQNLIIVENLFFSKPERAFFNYVLNNSTFSDSLGIRNQYLHGTNAGENADDNIHRENYYLFLILLIIIIIKLNDELCIKDSPDYVSEESLIDDAGNYHEFKD